jgi:hypothetical protein
VADIVSAFGEPQQIDKGASWRELNERFHKPAVANPSDFLLRDPKA